MSLAERISALTPEQRTLFEKLRDQQKRAARGPQAPPLRRRSGPAAAGDWPLSLDQERYWFMEQLRPGAAGLHIATATHMRGPLSAPAVAAALQEIVRRHAAWRTTFPLAGGSPVQRVAAGRHQELPLVDLSALAADRREAEARRLVGDDVAAPFDLQGGPLVRASLIRLAGEDHLCLLTVHHLVTDFLSSQVAWAELAALYAALAAGRPVDLPEPPVQYPDFAVWQREWLQGEALEELTAWWRERLAGFPLALDLPTDLPRAAAMRMRGGRRFLAASRELSDRWRALARGEGATLFMTVLAVLAALLHRLSGQEKLVLGANNANRSRPELQPLIGALVSQVPFPIDLTGDPPFRELLGRVRRSALDAYAHQDLPFVKLVEALQPARDASRQPIIQSFVQVLEPVDGQRSGTPLAGVSFEPVDAYDGNARYDLLLALTDDLAGLHGTLEYDADLFAPATAERLCEQLLLQVAAATADPDLRLSALPMLSAAARHQVLLEWGDTARPLPAWTVPERFAAQAARTPDALALAARGESLSFGDLDRRAGVLARRLRSLGVGPESRVALLLDRTLDVPAVLLAVWKAGGACVPLDPSSPPERLEALLADAEPAAVIHRGPVLVPLTAPAVDLAGPALAETPGEPLPPPVPPPLSGHLAYMIYTSGTTGLPKAVMVEHGSLAAVLAAVLDRFGFGPGDRMPHVSGFSFDISLFELLAPLLGGGACEILGREEILEPAALLPALARATRFHAVPSLMRQVADWARREPGRFAGLRTLLTGGDLVPPGLLAELREVFPAAEIAVLYGPTEGTIVCTHQAVPPEETPARTLIGRPFANAEARVIAGGGDAPPGVPGELWLGGPGVARGYFRREELTAERFVHRDGRRYYRSGDLVRRLGDGALEFLGRTDLQVKIRGFRVEPGEIEVRLAEHPAVREAVVALATLAGAPGERLLAAWCVPEGTVTAAELRGYLASRLPAYMVPSAFAILPELPVTAHGKVDRSRLPPPDAAAGPAEWVAPETPIEELLAGVAAEVLGLARVSMEDSFFDLGGHSLLATRLVSRLRQEHDLPATLQMVFNAKNFRELADRVVDAGLESAGDGLLDEALSGIEPLEETR